MDGIRRDVAKKAMLNFRVRLTADMNFWKFPYAVDEKIQCNSDGAV